MLQQGYQGMALLPSCGTIAVIAAALATLLHASSPLAFLSPRSCSFAAPSQPLSGTSLSSHLLFSSYRQRRRP